SHIKTKHSDRWVFFLICPIIALLSVHIGNENPIQELVLIPSYYSDLLLAFVLTYGTTYYLKIVTRNFALKHNSRLKLALYGVIIPVFVLIGIESIYLVFLLEITLEESSILYLELPLIFVFCLMIIMIFLLQINKNSS